MQWAAKASLHSPSLLALFPAHCECKNWTLSALRKKGCDVDAHGAVIEVTGKVVGGGEEKPNGREGEGKQEKGGKRKKGEGEGKKEHEEGVQRKKVGRENAKRRKIAK